MNRKKYLFKNTIIFGLSFFSTKLITFFLVPIYTKTLTPFQFGIVDMVFTICSFLFPVFTLNISEAIYRFSMDKNKNNNSIVTIGLICFLLSLVLGLLTIPIFNLFENYKDYSVYIYVYLITLSLSQILLVLLKGTEKLKLFSAGNIINTLTIALFNILFLVQYKMGIVGYFLGYIIANIITIIYGLICNKVVKNISKFEFDEKLFYSMIKYSIVLIPTSFMWWIINSSDRIMIAHFIGNEANGLYAIAYKLPSLLTMVASIFNQAWVFSAINEKDSDDYEKYTNRVFDSLFIVLTISAIGLLCVLRPLFKVYVDQSYFLSWKYVPFLVFGYVFMTLSTFISTSYNVHKDSKGFLFSGLTGAITNIVLNFIFIPLFGVYGAALATMLSYIAVFIYRVCDTRKYLKIYFRSNYCLLIILLLITCLITYYNAYLSLVFGLISMLFIVILNWKKLMNILKLKK